MTVIPPMNGTIEEVMQPATPERPEPRYGCIRVSMQLIQLFGVTILETDTQAKLQNEGIFDKVHQHLLLPEHYQIKAIFFEWLRGTWSIFVWSPELPVVPKYTEPPYITPYYRRNADGTNSLIEIKHGA